MKFISTKILSEHQQSQIFLIWNNESPKVISYEKVNDLKEFLAHLTEPRHILLIDKDKNVQGWFVDFITNDERWFIVILNSSLQGKSYGSKILDKAKEINSELNGWIINTNDYVLLNGNTYKSPIGFYRKNGFKVFPEIIRKTDELRTIKIGWKK